MRCNFLQAKVHEPTTTILWIFLKDVKKYSPYLLECFSGPKARNGAPFPKIVGPKFIDAEYVIGMSVGKQHRIDSCGCMGE
jgi:hypothetical protein